MAARASGSGAQQIVQDFPRATWSSCHAGGGGRAIPAGKIIQGVVRGAFMGWALRSSSWMQSASSWRRRNRVIFTALSERRVSPGRFRAAICPRCNGLAAISVDPGPSFSGRRERFLAIGQLRRGGFGFPGHGFDHIRIKDQAGSRILSRK